MTAVFVHGVPETTRVWEPLVSHLDRDDVVLLGLPGFGSPLPDGFDATMHTYAAWLTQELASFDEVDLVTHDWGAILALRVLADQPANVRSWVSDMGDLGPGFQWHDMAKTWQTPGDGEAMIDAMLGVSVADRAALLESVGAPAEGALVMSEGMDATMGDAILKLYRSATEVDVEWGPGIDSIRGPGLLVQSMKDPFRSGARVAKLAARTGAQVATLPESGHFWMLDAPEESAALISEFWSGVG